MTKHSIFFNIRLVFVFSLLSLFIVFFLISKMNSSSVLSELFDRYYLTVHVTDSILNSPSQEDVNRKLLRFNMALANGDKGIRLEDADVLLEKQLHRGNLRILRHQGSHYLYFAKNDKILLLRDLKPIDNKESFYWLIFSVVAVILIVTYVFTTRKIYPLKTLQQNIRQFGEGNLDIHCATDKKDEISDLANEFDQAIKKIKALSESRILFLRNIMHELKTPITKGRISTELLEDSRNKELMGQIFNRLDVLIGELANIEKLTSHNYPLNMKSYRFTDIVDHVIDMLFIENRPIHLDVKDENIHVDFDLFSIAVKNLIDNGLKYSKDGQVHIVKKNGSLEVINGGDPLEHPFEDYLKPFFNGKDQGKHRKSFGLGLYIVDHIVKIHRFRFYYTFHGGENTFGIALSSKT